MTLNANDIGKQLLSNTVFRQWLPPLLNELGFLPQIQYGTDPEEALVERAYRNSAALIVQRLGSENYHEVIRLLAECAERTAAEDSNNEKAK